MTRIASRLLRTRWFVRAPIWIFRVGLGSALGGRMMLLEHTGRRSGLRRLVVLEVIDHPRPECYVVVSGFGRRSQWFRNVEAQPRVRIRIGSRAAVDAVGRSLEPAAAGAAVDRYANAHPRAWARLRPVLEDTMGTRTDPSNGALAAVAFDITRHRD